MPAGARVQRARDRAAVKVDGTAGMGPLALPTCSAQDRSVVSRGGGAGIGLLASIAVGRNDRKHRLRRSALSRPRLLLASLSSSLGPKHRKSEESEREQRRCVIPRTVDARATSMRSFVAARLTDHDPDRPIESRRQQHPRRGVGSIRGGAVAAASPTENPLLFVASVPKPAYFFAAGAVAGAIGKTVTAPLDRVKILLQVKGGFSGSQVTAAASKGGFIPAFRAIVAEEGVRSFWKGNLPQVLRVLPYSALQLYGYETFKKLLGADSKDRISVPKRLAAGASAGMLATVLTYPLDTIRLRMAVDSSIKTLPQAVRILGRQGGVVAFYRGVGPAMLGVAPYMALELACFDFLKRVWADDKLNNPAVSFFSGFAAAMMASSVTYPLDTVRRQIQLQGGSMATMPTMFRSIFASEGAGGLYRGFVPSCLKNLPNKGIRLATFDTAKHVMTLAEQEKVRVEEAERKKRGGRRRTARA